jgi:hypothetical protein
MACVREDSAAAQLPASGASAVDAHATCKGAMLESKREATHVLPGKDGLRTATCALLCSYPIVISAAALIAVSSQ